ncbi:MAG TPA: tripartite tricarboxylate transporter TctB family protein [Candidatus Polarisedimenticolia bacterium]|nr:tripartite tricarboxylate transporter TctB family protein [Candidatus Polarisedimenticolia bacterium]
MDSPRVQRAVSAVLVCFGIAVLGLALRLPPATVQDPVGPRGFPGLLGLIVLACGVALAVTRPASTEANVEPRGALAPRSALGAIGLTALYLAVLEPAGYLLATPPYLAALLLAQGRVTRRAFVLTALGVPAVLYLLFAVLMRVPLPPGPLEPWLRGF